MRSPWRLLLLLALPLGGRAEWTVENIAGTGSRGFGGDGGPAATAVLNDPFGMARAPDGSLWFCEYGGHRLRRIAPDGTISTVAGTGERGFYGDGGPALAARLDKPHELRFDAAGDCYFTDMANHVIRRVERRTGLISTVAGTGGKRGYAGDGGPATSALLGQPHSLQFGPDGHLYLCDTGNHVVRRVDGRTGIITTVAGTGVAGPTPGGSPLAGTPLRGPRAIDFDAQGRLWLATREGNQVFRIDLQAGLIHACLVVRPAIGIHHFLELSEHGVLLRGKPGGDLRFGGHAILDIIGLRPKPASAWAPSQDRYSILPSARTTRSSRPASSS